jgi:hypothetical protein
MRSLLGRFRRPISRSQLEKIGTMVLDGDGSTLSLDFTTMSSLDSRFTFSRSGPATFINSSGLVQFANANMIRNSENCASWAGSQNITPTSDAATAPNGTQTADQLNLAASSFRYQTTFTTNSVGASYVGSIWMRTVSGTASVGFRIANTSTGSNSSIATCNVTETWQRFNTPSFTLTDTANRQIDIGVDQRSIVSGPNVAANIYVWGLQLQPGASVGEYLPTTTTENYSVPRFDHDPTTLAPRGLLIEGSATNVLTYSEQFNTAPWSAFTGSITANDGVAPDGNTTADSITPSSASGGVYFSNTFAAGTWTYSVWAKANPGNTISVSIDTSGNGRAVNVTLSTATAGTPFVRGTGGTVSSLTVNEVTKFPNSWCRISVTAVTTGTNFVAMSNPNDTNKILIWGAQLETGSGASSYIPTGASQVQRAADDCLIDNISTAFGFNASAGTILIRYGDRINTGSNRAYTFLPASGSNNQMFEGSGIAFNVFAGGSFTAQIGSTAPSAGRVCAAYAANDFAVSVNGGAVATDTNGAVASSLTRVSLGGSAVNAAAYNFGPIAVFKYWPTRLPNATLQSLTA